MGIPRILRRVVNKGLYAINVEQLLRRWNDERYLKLVYLLRTGQRLNLATPVTFSEKLQWLKLFDRKPIYTTLVDKYDVKEWVASRIGGAYIVPNLGVWDSFDEINFSQLPEQFVLKSTHDSGGMVICSDRSNWDIEAAQEKIKRSLARNYFYHGREWPYRDVSPRVLAEVYLPDWTPNSSGERQAATSFSGHNDAPEALAPSRDEGMIDYKFYCFHGEPRFLYVSQGLHDHKTARMNFLSTSWERIDLIRSDYDPFEQLPDRPSTLNEMVEIARELSSNIPFVRVDLFEHRTRVLFSEMTFYPVSGMVLLEPGPAERTVGAMLDLSRIY